MPLRIGLGLLACNLIWSAHPVMGKWLLEAFHPTVVAWLRYSSAFVAYFLAYLVMRRKSVVFFSFPRSLQDRALVLLMGLMAFFFSPLIQTIGLNQSLATENAILVALEPLLTVGLAWVFLRERVEFSQKLAFWVAMLGFLLLSGVVQNAFHSGSAFSDEVTSGSAHMVGNLLILCSLLGEASFSVIGKKLGRSYSPLGVFGSAMVFGVFLLSLTALSQVLAMTWNQEISFSLSQTLIEGFSQPKVWVALIWIGPVGTTLAYLYLLFALRQVPVFGMATFLFLQPLVGGLLGYFFLGDRLGVFQILGTALIFLGVALSFVQFRLLRFRVG